jgi:large subunit ribosomal protein L3
MNTLYAKKMIMTGKYTPKGERVGSTLLTILPAKVLDLRDKQKHGYEAIRLHVTNGKLGITKEVRTEEKLEVGTEIKLEEILKVGDMVTVSGKTKGKGYAGVVKRYNFRGGPRTHGTSDRERAPGSSGSTTTPGRVYKGKRRGGRMGMEKVTIKNLEVLEVNGEKGQLTIKGSVPGSYRNTLLTVVKQS